MASTSTNGIARKCAINGLLGRAPSPRPDTSGIPLSEILGRALAAASGQEYQPPRLAEIEDVLGSDSFRLLMENPKIKQAITLWANARDADRASLIRPMAILIADEAGQPGLAWRIRKEIAEIE